MGRFKGDLVQRSYSFGLAILDIVDSMPNSPKGWHVTRQVLKSGTSIGANAQEADGALTPREFAQF